MRARLFLLGVLLCAGASSAKQEEQSHSFVPSDLSAGAHPALHLKRIGNYDVATLVGKAKVKGTFVAEWIFGPDEDKVPTQKSYTFVVDQKTAESLPHWMNYVATSIDIDNGKEALVMFAGSELAHQFEAHAASKISVPGTLSLSKLQVWVECDSANARAHATADSDVGKPIVEKKVADLTCSGPSDD